MLLPQLALASDYSGLVPFYVAFVMLIGGAAAGFEWLLINAVNASRQDDGDDESTDKKKRRFGCGFGTALWIVNSVATHFIIMAVWSP